MGRAPCCDKANVKKGPWSPEEDATLKAYIEEHGTGGNWIALPQKIGLKRCGKSCRLRWLNYLRPNIKHGGFSEEEDNIICSLYISIGSRWSIIAGQLPGRTDNDIKNYWNTRLKKKLLGKQRKEQQIREAGLAKHEIKRESESFMVPTGAMNQQIPSWPELPAVLPVMNQNQDMHFMDQESITNLLINLGGRFSDSSQESSITAAANSTPLDTLCSQDQLYASSVSTGSQLPSCMNSVNGPSPNTYQGLVSSPFELEDLFYGNAQAGVDSFYGMDMTNVSTGTSSAESSSWGHITSMIYPPLVSEYENCLQSIPQHSSFQDLSFFGPQ